MALPTIYRGYEVTKAGDRQYEVTTNGGPVLHTAKTESDALDWIDAERRRQFERSEAAKAAHS